MISVVIVNFNSGDHLTNALASLEKDEKKISQIVIVDNASSDDSLDKVTQSPHSNIPCRIVRNNANIGFSAAVNIGIEETDGQYLLILNPDCTVENNAIDALVEVLNKNSEIGMVGGLVLNPDGTEQTGCRRKHPKFGKAFFRVMFGKRAGKLGFDLTDTPLPNEPVEIEAISGACMMVRRAALNDVGLMDEDYFLHCEDLDWCRRFGNTGWKIIFVPSAKVTHLKGMSSKDRPIRVLWHKHRGMWRYHCKFDAHRHSALFNAAVYLGIQLYFIWQALLGTAKRLLTH